MFCFYKINKHSVHFAYIFVFNFCCLGLVHAWKLLTSDSVTITERIVHIPQLPGRQSKRKKTYTSCKKNKFPINIFFLPQFYKVWEAIFMWTLQKFFSHKNNVFMEDFLCGLTWLKLTQNWKGSHFIFWNQCLGMCVVS